jgi:8-oxo-dGTP diphosphatase
MPFTYQYPHPAVSTDAVLFTVEASQLKVLLIERKHDPYAGTWAFPGGFLDMHEDLQTCAERELAEETGVSGIRLEQFHAAGTPDRDPRERNISILHMGMVRPGTVEPKAADDAAAVGWFRAHRPPKLAFDHKPLLKLALKHLATKLTTSDAALRFLPGRFTLTDLQQVYEAVLNKPLDARTFRREILSLDWLAATGDTAQHGRRRENLYRAARRRSR